MGVPMQDRPTASELLTAVQRFLEEEVVPALSGRTQFLARVAANAVGIVRREIELEEDNLRREWERLAALYSDCDAPPQNTAELRQLVRAYTERLCEEIRNGGPSSPERRKAIHDHVRETVADKLRISDPRFLGRAAR